MASIIPFPTRSVFTAWASRAGKCHVVEMRVLGPANPRRTRALLQDILQEHSGVKNPHTGLTISWAMSGHWHQSRMVAANLRPFLRDMDELIDTGLVRVRIDGIRVVLKPRRVA